jgi:hypothetical protein
MAVTIDRRELVILLNNVDLPTLGRAEHDRRGRSQSVSEACEKSVSTELDSVSVYIYDIYKYLGAPKHDQS